MRHTLKDYFETTIDNIGLVETLELIAEICNEKSEHVETNWQDGPLSKTWNIASMKIDNTANWLRDRYRTVFTK